MMTVFMTGAGGGMGYESFKQMLPDIGKLYKLIILVRDSEKNHDLFDRYDKKKAPVFQIAAKMCSLRSAASLTRSLTL